MNEQGRQKVLVVDDHDPMRFLWKTVLKQLGIEVDEAANGQAALDLVVRGEQYGLILMDISMPVMTGIEAVRAIREHEQSLELTRLRIVAVTSGAATKDKCLEAGMDDYFEKPANIEDLRLIIETAAPDLIDRDKSKAAN